MANTLKPFASRIEDNQRAEAAFGYFVLLACDLKIEILMVISTLAYLDESSGALYKGEPI
jgi:hypothetical protein